MDEDLTKPRLHGAWGGKLEAEAPDADGMLPVSGCAAPFGVVGWFPGGRYQLSASVEILTPPEPRAQMLLVCHDESRCLTSTAAGRLVFDHREDGLYYRALLNPESGEQKDAWVAVDDGSWKSSSIGFSILASHRIKAVDNSPESTTGDKKVAVTEATKILVWEVSLLPEGAFVGATALAATASGDEAVAKLLAADPRLEARMEAGVWVVRRTWEIDGESERRYDDATGQTTSAVTETYSETTTSGYEEGGSNDDDMDAGGDDEAEASASSGDDRLDSAAGDEQPDNTGSEPRATVMTSADLAAEAAKLRIRRT